MFRQVSAITLLFSLWLTSWAAGPPGDQWQVTPSGIRYIIHAVGAECRKPVYGDMIWMHLEKMAPDGELLFSTRDDPFFSGGVEIAMKAPQFNGDIIEAFTLLCPGDSAEIQIAVDSVDREKTYMKKTAGKYYSYRIKLITSLSPQDFSVTLEENRKIQYEADSAAILEYTVYKNMETNNRDEHGIVWVHTSADPRAPRLAPGDSVSVHYRLKLLDETPVDDSYARDTPFSFVLGKGNVIEGWELGLQHFGLGERGYLFIPSELGYGRHGSGISIPPNTVLIFEVEIVDVFK